MEWILIFTAGFFAAGVDGALGMGFGPTSATLLLSTGLSPASTSVAVNVAKAGAGLAAGIAHWRFDNIDRRLTMTLALPGALGALIGVAVLSNVDSDWLRPALAVLLCLVGIRMLRQFGPSRSAHPHQGQRLREGVDWTTATVGAAGGCTNGLIGAWGPVVTPFLIHRRIPVRIAVGSVNTAEVAVAVVAVAALFSSGTGSIKAGVVVPMLVGGVAAAPLAAHLVRRVPPRAAGISVATLLLLSQGRELATAANLGPERWLAYGATILLVLVTARPMRRVDPDDVAVASVAAP